MRQLRLKRVLSKEEDEFLRGRGSRKLKPLQPTEKDFDPDKLIAPGEDVQVLKDEDGSLLFMVLTGAFEMKDVARAYESLKTVKGDCTTRTEVTGGKNEKRKGASRQTGASEQKIVEYRRKGCEANILGYMDKMGGGRFPYCRQTAWTERNPEVLKDTWPLVRAADRLFKEYVPDRYALQWNHVSEVLDFTLGTTVFTSVTVNKKLSTTYHRDENDFVQGFGVMFTLGKFKGGQLVFPAFRCAVDYQPGSMILADVHETHGNLDNIVGNRITCVLYAREKINECAVDAQGEEERHAGKMILSGAGMAVQKKKKKTSTKKRVVPNS